MAGRLLAQECEAVAEVSRSLAAEGLVYGTSGNVSARSGEHVAITPTGGVLADLQADQITVVDLDGTLLDGPLAPTSEIDLHLGVYRRYQAGAVVHTHAPMATALSCVVEQVPCVHYDMLRLGGDIPVAPYATFGTRELADAVVEAMEGKAAVLMANHGTVTHGADAQAAADATRLLEWACTVYWRAAQLGDPRALTEDERQAVIEAAVGRGYGQTKEATA